MRQLTLDLSKKELTSIPLINTFYDDSTNEYESIEKEIKDTSHNNSLSRTLLRTRPHTLVNPHVQWLILSHNNLLSLKNINYYPSLTRLALNDNSLIDIAGISHLKNLTWLDLTRNKLTDLPFMNLQQLQGLGLSENKFKKIPITVFNLISLRKFGFFSNRLQILPPLICNLVNLIKLDLSNNQLEYLPKELFKLKKLVWLNLSNNKLKSISGINELRQLEELGLGNNQLTDLCINLPNLKILPAYNNCISKVKIKCINLEKLDLSDNKIENIDWRILESRKLKYLNIKNNLLKKIEIVPQNDKFCNHYKLLTNDFINYEKGSKEYYRHTKLNSFLENNVLNKELESVHKCSNSYSSRTGFNNNYSNNTYSDSTDTVSENYFNKSNCNVNISSIFKSTINNINSIYNTYNHINSVITNNQSIICGDTDIMNKTGLIFNTNDMIMNNPVNDINIDSMSIDRVDTDKIEHVHDTGQINNLDLSSLYSKYIKPTIPSLSTKYSFNLKNPSFPLSLDVLDISHNQIEYIPFNFYMRIKNIQNLRVNNNKFEQELENGEKLNNNKLTEMCGSKIIKMINHKNKPMIVGTANNNINISKIVKSIKMCDFCNNEFFTAEVVLYRMIDNVRVEMVCCGCVMLR